jgi:hypothetical protein
MTWFLTKATVMGDEASIVVLKIYNNVGYPSKSNARFVREAIEWQVSNALLGTRLPATTIIDDSNLHSFLKLFEVHALVGTKRKKEAKAIEHRSQPKVT